VSDPGAGVPIEILLVEDNPADVVLTEAVLAEAKVANRLWVARDGKEAMEFLRREARQPKSPRPDLVLLDLNLPRKGGLEVLAEMKADRALRAIPVVVLTTSAAERDVLAAYDQHVNAYITKPVDLDQFVAVVRAVDDFWLAVVRLPRRS
jgi:two-component system, chemotaxis family, response regulator Rcp1